MQITFKLLLDNRYIKKDLTLSLKLRVYQNGNYKEYSLGISLNKEDWQQELQTVKSNHPNSKFLNTKLSKIKAKLQQYILLAEDDEDLITAAEILNKVKQIDKKKTVSKKLDIIEFGKERITKLENSGHIGNSICYSCAINKLASFTKKDTLLFEEVNYKFLEKFNSTLLSEGIKVNSIANYLRTIRALFRRAIKEESLEAKYYPFNNFKIKHEATINRNLSVNDLQKIISLSLLPNSNLWHSRNIFLLSFCLIGLNLSDLLTLTKASFIDGRIVFRRRKTHKVYSIRIQLEAWSIFQIYSSNETPNADYVMPFVINKEHALTLKKDILQVVKNTNDHLKKIAKMCGISKGVTTYYARYSWANAAKGLGYSKDMIAEALGHNYGNKVTGIYLDNYSHDIIDEMNKRVIKAIFQYQKN